MHICPFIEQYTAKLNTPPTRDSRENRLSFFYADRQRDLKSLLSLKREFSPAHHSEAPRALRALDTHAVT